MKTWTVQYMRTAQGDHAVFVNEELVERGLSERQAAAYVQAWTPPGDLPSSGLYTCECGDAHDCPRLVGPYDARLSAGSD